MTFISFWSLKVWPTSILGFFLETVFWDCRSRGLYHVTPSKHNPNPGVDTHFFSHPDQSSSIKRIEIYRI